MAPFRDVSPAVRIRMAQISKTNTRPELCVRKLVHSMGFRFSLHRKDLPGTPDIVLPRHRSVIYVHGCFWHRHDCRLGQRPPKARPDYWLPKLDRNVARDRQSEHAITELGWRALIVWECETRDLEPLTRKIRSFLEAVPGEDEPRQQKRRSDSTRTKARKRASR